MISPRKPPPPKETRIIKRYPNRKLYDTATSCYVTLDEIAQFIRDGEEVQVVDHKTREDLTNVTLSQILFEEEKKKRNLLPLQALRRIIQSGGEQLFDFFQKSFQQGVSSIHNVRDEAERVIDKIRDEIEDSSSFIRDFLTKSHQGVDEFSKRLEEKLKSIGRVTNVPHLLGEIRSLQKKVSDLERKLRRFEK